MEINKNESGFLNLRNIITLVLVATSIVLLGFIMTKIGKTSRSSDPMDDLRYYLKHSSYNDMYICVKNLRRADYKGDKEYKKYEAIADYYINSIRYYTYENMESEKAGECKNVMAEQRRAMEDLEFAADEIDEKFAKYE